MVTPDGDTIYIDYELVKKHNNSVFFHILYDNLMPKTNEGTMSWNNYLQFKCNTREFRFLTQKYYKNPMGKGKPFLEENKPNINFSKSTRGSFKENIGNNLCTRLN